MKKHPLLAIALLSMVFFLSCEPQKHGSATTQDSLVVAADSVPVLPAESECGSLQPGQFCASGLDILQLGDSLAWNANLKASLPDAILKDTVITEITEGISGKDTVSWFAKIMRMPDGDIYLDSDFNEGFTMGRVRIESGRYHHSSGLRVGSTGKELKAFTNKAFVIPFEAYGVMEVIIPFQTSRMIFHVPQEGIYNVNKGQYQMSDIPDDAKIVRIVLM